MSDVCVCVWLNVMLCLYSISEPASLVIQCSNSKSVCAEDPTRLTNCSMQDICSAASMADYRSTMTNLTEGSQGYLSTWCSAITFRQTYEYIPTIDMDGPLMMLEYEYYLTAGYNTYYIGGSINILALLI